jgi:chromosome segregation ATPase
LHNANSFGERVVYNLLLLLLQAQLESATRAARDYEQAAHASDSQLREASRQLQELQQRAEELGRRSEAAERARQQAEEQAKQQLAAAEVRGRPGSTLQLLTCGVCHMLSWS